MRYLERIHIGDTATLAAVQDGQQQGSVNTNFQRMEN
jgi:hypothetical protein